MSRPDADVLVIGAGPAGASVAIRLARLGWRVVVIEQSPYPRQKVCGECLGPASLGHLHDLGVAAQVLAFAGPEIRRVAWMTRGKTATAAMPPCRSGPYLYGRAIGRDLLDSILLDRARELGVRVIQPARARHLHGAMGQFICEYRSRSGAAERPQQLTEERISVPIVVDAHGSWEQGPTITGGELRECDPPPLRDADLLGFKATFLGTSLAPGLLPVLSLPGGYGGMVVSDRAKTTVACCVRRDTLREWRLRFPGSSAGAVVEAFSRSSCQGLAAALEGARLRERWHSIGPVRPGFRAPRRPGVFSVGNALAEVHPLIGEGICMALESAALVAALLGRAPSKVDASLVCNVQEAYLRAVRHHFSLRLRLASLYAHLAMHERIANAIAALIQSWPGTLTFAAQIAGKALDGSVESLVRR